MVTTNLREKKKRGKSITFGGKEKPMPNNGLLPPTGGAIG